MEAGYYGEKNMEFCSDLRDPPRPAPIRAPPGLNGLEHAAPSTATLCDSRCSSPLKSPSSSHTGCGSNSQLCFQVLRTSREQVQRRFVSAKCKAITPTVGGTEHIHSQLEGLVSMNPQNWYKWGVAGAWAHRKDFSLSSLQASSDVVMYVSIYVCIC